jgi:hypothetical protein
MEIIKKHKEKMLVDVIDEQYEECDKCGKKIELDNMYDAYDTTIERKGGAIYPEAGYIYVEYVDLCKKCSRELFNFLRAKGYRVQKETRDI